MRKKNEQATRHYTTLDSYQAGWLVLREHTPQLIEKNGKVVFVFLLTEILLKDLADYNSGATVEAVRFALIVEDLKSQVFLLKNKTGLWDWD
jgi:hypothetical protein